MPAAAGSADRRHPEAAGADQEGAVPAAAGRRGARRAAPLVQQRRALSTGGRAGPAVRALSGPPTSRRAPATRRGGTPFRDRTRGAPPRPIRPAPPSPDVGGHARGEAPPPPGGARRSGASRAFRGGPRCRDGRGWTDRTTTGGRAFAEIARVRSGGKTLVPTAPSGRRPDSRGEGGGAPD